MQHLWEFVHEEMRNGKFLGKEDSNKQVSFKPALIISQFLEIPRNWQVSSSPRDPKKNTNGRVTKRKAI
jgi:hypothetical protein